MLMAKAPEGSKLQNDLQTAVVTLRKLSISNSLPFK